MQLKDLKPSFVDLPVDDKLKLIMGIQKSRMTIKEAVTPTQEKIRKNVRRKTAAEKQAAEIQERIALIQKLKERKKQHGKEKTSPTS